MTFKSIEIFYRLLRSTFYTVLSQTVILLEWTLKISWFCLPVIIKIQKIKIIKDNHIIWICYILSQTSCFLRRPQKLTKSSPSIWRLLVKLTVKIFSILVAFLENKNFNDKDILFIDNQNPCCIACCMQFAEMIILWDFECHCQITPSVCTRNVY